jgi:predicted RNase H-like nuclease
MNIIGLDVGFSQDRPTSGVAHLDSTSLRLGHATSEWSSRERVLGPINTVEVAAVDAPIVPDVAHGQRDVERLLSSGIFQRRCKPGASHVRGTGQGLRQAGRETASQLASVTPERPLPKEFPRAWKGTNIVEAFPNAFLGVCLDESLYAEMPKLKRGEKFDWLFDAWCRGGLFPQIAALFGLETAGVVDACHRTDHHDERGALVCLFTAASVATGQYVAMGEKLGGYIFLPPWQLWSNWARREVDHQRQRLPWLDVWIDGRSYILKEALPSTSALA